MTSVTIRPPGSCLGCLARKDHTLHRIVASNGDARQSRLLRWILALAYLLFSVSGVALLLSPVMADVYGRPGYVYSTFIAVGGFLAMAGTITLRWVGEFTGLPLLASALAAYAVEVLNIAFDETPFVAIANASSLFAIVCLMGARWRISLAAYQLARRVADKPPEGDTWATGS